MATGEPSATFCHDAKIQPKTNVEPSWNNTSVFLGNDVQIFPETLRAHGNSAEDCMGLLTDFKKELQQIELQASHLVQVEAPVHPFPLNITNTMNKGMKIQ